MILPVPSYAAVTPVYDTDGNLTTGTVPLDPTVASTFVWDGENRLISVTTSGVTTKYLYDVLGRRVMKTVASNRTYYLYDDWNLVAEYSGAVHTTGTAPAVTWNRTYLWGLDIDGTMQGAGGVGGLLAVDIKTGGSAGVYYPTYDLNGNISEYVDDTGTEVAHYEYDPFGRTVVDTDTGGLFDIRFSTKKCDPESGLYYYGYRYYDPQTGRWPSRDPIEEQGGVNLYGFLDNDPIGNGDFLGLSNFGPDSKGFASLDAAMTAALEEALKLTWTPSNKTPQGRIEYGGLICCVESNKAIGNFHLLVNC